MNSAQKVIKYLALALAALLVCGIFSGIVGTAVIVGRIAGGWQGSVSAPSTAEIVEWDDVEVEKIREIHIDIKAANLKVERGEKFAIRGEKDVIELRQSGAVIYIEEKDIAWMSDWWDRGGEVTVILPKDMRELDAFYLQAGAGKVDVSDVAARRIDFDLGAGRVEMSRVTATEQAEIDGGAGLLIVRNSVMKNLDLDMGVGKVELGLELSGKNEINAGVGKLDLRLSGKEEDYRFEVSKGLGSITLNGSELGNDTVKGVGVTSVKIEGGVGAIEIKTGE